MRIAKGVITAAGHAQRRIPLQTLVDTDGETRTVLAMLINEQVNAGIEEICVVCAPDDEIEYSRAVGDHKRRVRFVTQSEPRGYAHALWSASEFIGQEPFLHLVSDHVYVGRGNRNCAATIVETATEFGCSVSGVQPTHETLVTRFGVVGGSPASERPSLYNVDTVLEKPTPTEAEEKLLVSGLRSSYYLAFFGMHVLTPAVVEIIHGQLQGPSPQSASVSAALNTLIGMERYLALRVSGQRYDLGSRYGLLNAQFALTLAGKDREEVLGMLLTLLATGSQTNGGSPDGE